MYPDSLYHGDFQPRADFDRLADQYWRLRMEHRDDEARAVYAQLGTPEPMTYTNERGCLVQSVNVGEAGPYTVGRSLPPGWRTMDTPQDAPYFAVWVNPETLQTLTYAEGDLTLSTARDADAYRAEIEHAADFYGVEPSRHLFPAGLRAG